MIQLETGAAVHKPDSYGRQYATCSQKYRISPVILIVQRVVWIKTMMSNIVFSFIKIFSILKIMQAHVEQTQKAKTLRVSVKKPVAEQSHICVGDVYI